MPNWWEQEQFAAPRPRQPWEPPQHTGLAALQPPSYQPPQAPGLAALSPPQPEALPSVEQLRRYTTPLADAPTLPKPPESVQPPPQPGLLSDIGNLLKSGYADTARGLNWLAGKVPGLNQVVDAESGQQYWADVAQGAHHGLSTAQQQAGEKKFFNDDGSLGSAWSDPRAYLGTVVESVPGTVMGMGLGGPLTGGLQRAGLAALPRLGAVGAERLAMGAGAVGYGAGEGLIAGGSDAVNARDVVLQRSHEDLQQNSSQYRALLESMTPDQARARLAEEVANQVGLEAGLTVAATGAPMGAMFGKLFHGSGQLGKTLLGSVGVGAAGEAGQEFVQSGAEQYLQNKAIQQQVDPSQDRWQGVLNQAVAGALAGGIMGGAMAGGGHGTATAHTKREAQQAAAQTGQAAEAALATANQARDDLLNADDRVLADSLSQLQALQQAGTLSETHQARVGTVANDIQAEMERRIQRSATTETGQSGLPESFDPTLGIDNTPSPTDASANELQRLDELGQWQRQGLQREIQRLNEAATRQQETQRLEQAAREGRQRLAPTAPAPQSTQGLPSPTLEGEWLPPEASRSGLSALREQRPLSPDFELLPPHQRRAALGHEVDTLNQSTPGTARRGLPDGLRGLPAPPPASIPLQRGQSIELSPLLGQQNSRPTVSAEDQARLAEKMGVRPGRNPSAEAPQANPLDSLGAVNAPDAIQQQAKLVDTSANKEGAWAAFPPETGSLGVPRAQMPQIKAEHRGALVNFLKGRGIEQEADTVPAASLKPTQAEFSPQKVQQALGFKGGNRSILVSQDNHVVDGHHQWLAAVQKNEPVPIIRLNAPIAHVLDQVKQFPSATSVPSSDSQEVATQPQPDIIHDSLSEKGQAQTASVLNQESPASTGADSAPQEKQFSVRPTGYPDGSWHVVDQDGNVERFGAPEGQLAKRFKTDQSALAAAERLNAKNTKAAAANLQTRNDQPISTRPAKYRKGAVIPIIPASTDGFKTRAMRLAEAVGGKWVHREQGYVMSAAQAKRLQALYAQGHDASAMTGKLLAAETSPSAEKADIPSPAKPLPAASRWNQATTEERTSLLQAAGIHESAIPQRAQQWGRWSDIPEGDTKARLRQAMKQREARPPASDTRFSKSSFGQTPGLFEKPDIQVTSLTGNEISTVKQPWALRSAVKEFAQRYRSQSFINQDTEARLSISKEGFRHLFGGNKTTPELQAAAALPSLIRHAVLADTHADRKNEAQVREMWRLFAPLDIDGQLYRVKLTVKNRYDGVRNFHEIDAIQIENPAVNAREVVANGSTPYRERPSGSLRISISQLLQGATRDSDGQPFSPEARNSQPSTNSAQPITSAQARAQLADALGEHQVKALERSGRLVIHETDPTKTGAAGFVDRRGVIHLVASNLENGDALSVTLHEAMHVAKDDRFHEGNRAHIRLAHAALRLFGLKNFIGNPGFTGIVQEAYRLAAAGNKTAQQALAKAQAEFEADPNTDVPQELVAYLVQYADEKLPLVRRVLSAIRAAMYRMGIKVRLTPADIRALALSALKAQARAAIKSSPQTTRAQAAYSQPNARNLTDDQRFEYAVAGLKILASNRDLFKYPISQQKDIAAIAADLSPKIKVSRPDASRQNPLRAFRSFGQSWTVTMPDGATADVLTSKSGREVYIDASGLEKGQSTGSLLYQLVGQWAYNNGKVFVGDPEGISPAGKARRLEHLISLALKFGTTDHFMPHPDQNIPWRVGDHGYNLAQMLKASSEIIQAAVPAIREMRYDFGSGDGVGRFIESATGRVVGDDAFERIANRPRARAAQAGATTLKRSVLVDTVVQGTGRAEWRPLLGELARLGGAEQLDPQLQQIFYSQPTREADTAEQARLWEEFQAIQAQFKARQANTTAFQRWFGSGVEGITAKNGKPLTLYHGTPNEFHQFDGSRSGINSKHPTAGLGFFMTADQGAAYRYGSNVLALHAKIENPYYLTDADLMGVDSIGAASKLRRTLQEQGYDGAVVTGPGLYAPYVIAFESKQVKLASNQNPTDSPDFRYSMPDAPEGSVQWANNAYAKQEIPEGWYVHGRASSSALRNDAVIQLTESWDVAKQYGGGNAGSIWLIKPKEDAAILDFSNHTTDDIESVANKAWKDFQDGSLPFENDITASLGENPTEEAFKDNIKSLLSPDNIVDTAGFFDAEPAWINWLWENFESGFIKTPDGAVALDTAFIDAVKVDKDTKIRYSRPGRPTLSDTLPTETKAQAFQRQVQDKFNRFAVAQKWLKDSGIDLTASADVYGAEALLPKKTAAATETARETVLKPLIQQAAANRWAISGGQLIDAIADDQPLPTTFRPSITEYLHAQHAKERNAQIAKINPQFPDGGSGLTNAQADQILERYRRMAGFALFQKLAGEFQAITNQTRETLLKAGIVSSAMAEAWKAAYKTYVPLKGGPEDATQRSGTGGGISVNGKQKRALGHTLRDENIIENIWRDHERAIYLAQKQEVARALKEMLTQANNENIGTVGQPEKRAVLQQGWYHQVWIDGAPLGAFPSYADAKAAIAQDSQRTGRAVGQYGIRHQAADPSVIYTGKPMLQDNEVALYEDGQLVRLQLHDDLLARAARNLGVDAANGLLKAGQAFNRWLSSAYTGYSPEFLVTNPVRDFTAGFINLTGQYGMKTAAKVLRQYPSAVRALWRHIRTGSDPLVDQYRQAGGSTGAAYLSDLERIGTDIKTVFQDMQGAKATWESGDKAGAARVAVADKLRLIGRHIENLNKIGENALRVATFQTLLKEGHSEADAARAAGGVTVNFNRKGELTSQLGGLYLFFNPSIQGTKAIWDALAKGPKRHQAQALAGSLVGLAFFLAQMARGDDDDSERRWKALPGYTKDRNMLIPLGDGDHLTIPVPYGYGAFWSLGNILSDVMHGEDATKLGIRLASTLFEHFSPVGNPFAGDEADSRNIVSMLPTALKPAVSLAMNHSELGRPVMPEVQPWNPNKPDSQRMWRSTQGSLWERMATGLNTFTGGDRYQAGAIDVSPESMKFIWRTLTGGAGQFAADTANLFMTMGQGAGTEITIREIPFVRKFVRESSIQDARTLFYEQSDQVRAAESMFSAAKRDRNQDAMHSMAQEQQELLALGRLLDATGKQIKARRQLADAIERSDLPLAAKRRQLEAVEQQEAAIYGTFNRLFVGADEKKRGRLAMAE